MSYHPDQNPGGGLGLTSLYAFTEDSEIYQPDNEDSVICAPGGVSFITAAALGLSNFRQYIDRNGATQYLPKPQTGVSGK